MDDPHHSMFLTRVAGVGSPDSEGRRSNQMWNVAQIHGDVRMSLYQAFLTVDLAEINPRFRKPGVDHRVSLDSCDGWATGVFRCEFLVSCNFISVAKLETFHGEFRCRYPLL